MEKSESALKIMENEDFINAPKFGNSLDKFITKMEAPLENAAIGRLLLISPEEVEAIYQESIIEIRKEMCSIDEEFE